MKNFLCISVVFSAIFWGCVPEQPATSSITIDMESVTIQLNDKLYGLCINEGEEEMAISAEYIGNQSFENDEMNQGWKAIATNTYVRRSENHPLNDENKFSLLVSVFSETGLRGGVAAEGINGITLKKGERYFLSFYIRTSINATPASVQIAFEDSSMTKHLSHPFEVLPSTEWRKYTHTIVATEDATEALLTFSMNKSSFFYMDMVSLMPDNTWRNHGLRADILEKVDSLSPSFIVYNGENNAEEKHGFYRQMATDLKADIIFSFEGLNNNEVKLCADENYFISGRALSVVKNMADVWVNGLTSMDESGHHTLRSAVAEACFLTGAESNPRNINRISFTPISGSYEDNKKHLSPLILMEEKGYFATPSYYLLKMFSENRGDALLKYEVKTYSKPQIFAENTEFNTGNSFEINDWNVVKTKPYNYEISAVLKRINRLGTATIQINSSTFMTVGAEKTVIYQQTGLIRDTLSTSEKFDFPEDIPIPLRIVCNYDTIKCLSGDSIIHDIVFPSLPSITAVATLDRKTRTILLKVVNTTLHNEITEINIKGANISYGVSFVQMKGEPEMYNTSDSPYMVVPFEGQFNFSYKRLPVYKFPPNSITVLRMKLK